MNSCSADGNTPLGDCLRSQSAMFGPVSLEQWAKTIELLIARDASAEAGSSDALRRLIAAGADVNATNVEGETPLFLAARSKRTESVRCLLDHGAASAVRNAAGRTALDVALQSGDAGLFNLLLAST